MRIPVLPKITPTLLRTGLLAAAAFLTLSAATAQQGAPAGQDLVLQGGTLIDGTGKAPIPDAVIVVRGTRITAVGRRGQVQVPANANVINLAGRTILPGLIDDHVHSEEWHMPMFIHYGVTTMADQNSDPAWIVAQREALQKGRIKGPRMFVAGTNMHGTYGFTLPPDYTWNYDDVHSAQDARAFAKSMLALGADIIKVDQNIDDAQQSATIQVAKEAGVPAVGHTRNIRRAAELGFKFAEHTWTIANATIYPDAKNLPDVGGRLAKAGAVIPEARMDMKAVPALVDYLVKQGVYVNPTLANGWRGASPRAQEYAAEAAQMLKDPGLAFVPTEVKEKWTKIPKMAPGADKGWPNVVEFLRQYAKAGGKAVVGTDSELNSAPGLTEHYEMQMLVDVGYSPMQAIQAATLWNAQLLKKDKDIGSIEPGKIADFLVIEGDPLANISATKNIRMVIMDGKVVDTKYDPNWVNPIPQPYSMFQERPAPGVTNVTPAVVHQGSPTVTLQVEGVKFTPNAIVRFDDTDLPTKFVSSTQLTATLSAQLLQSRPGSYALYVVMPGTHGTVSATGYEVIDTAANPVTAPGAAPTRPLIFGPTPRGARQGGKTVPLQIDGTNFTPTSVVRFDNSDLPTKYVSGNKLTASLDASLLQRHAGSYVVYVVNKGPNGIVSEPSYFLVNLKE